MIAIFFFFRDNMRNAWIIVRKVPDSCISAPESWQSSYLPWENEARASVVLKFTCSGRVMQTNSVTTYVAPRLT